MGTHLRAIAVMASPIGAASFAHTTDEVLLCAVSSVKTGVIHRRRSICGQHLDYSVSGHRCLQRAGNDLTCSVKTDSQSSVWGHHGLAGPGTAVVRAG